MGEVHRRRTQPTYTLDRPTLPLLKGKTRVKGRSTAYVCENHGCQLPVTSPADLAEQLRAK